MKNNEESVKVQADPALGIDELPAQQKMRVKFGYWVLGFLALYILISIFMYYFAAPSTIGPSGSESPKLEAAKVIFSFSKELLPLATLILGYFFGSRGYNGE